MKMFVRFLALAVPLMMLAMPAHAGWLQDAVGSIIGETKSDLQALVIILGGIGFIVGTIGWIFQFMRIWVPVVSVIAVAAAANVDTFIS